MKSQFFLYVSLFLAGVLLAPVQAQEANSKQQSTPTSLESVDAAKPSSTAVEVKPERQPNPEFSAQSTTDEVKILSPAIDAVIDVPAAMVVVQAPEGKQVELRVNGVLVSDQLIGRTETDQKSGQVLRTYYGVSLQPGSNTISAQIIGASQSAQVTVQVRGEAEKLSVQAAEAKIPADGRSTAAIRGELLDGQGNRSNRDALITLSTTAGEFLDTDAAADQPGFQVKAERGQFTARLRSGLEARTVTIRAAVGKLEDFTQLQFETNLRPSIATGVIDLRFGRQGTDFYRSFRDFLPVNRDNNYQLDFGAAVFATGRIGDWLLTGAYNSARPLNETCDGTNSLFRPNGQSCDQNYSVYGDSSESTILTPSIDSLFLKLERTSPVAGAGTDYAMWGDYTTEEFATRSQEFSATNRQLHGFKTNYNFGNLQITGLFANNIQGFQRDTLVPDGTSGFYFLSRRLLVEGSESIFLELEELNRPGTVLKRQQLSRGKDYEIDYDRGTILFREPIARTDVGEVGETLVRRIVSTYQYDTPGSDSRMFAGRVRYHFARGLNRESWLGATYLREDQGTRDFELYGADAFVSLGQNSHALAEYARSTNLSDVLGLVSGSAYRFELESKLSQGIDARAYYRQADTGFANNATVSFVPGQTRYGTQLTAQVGKTTNLRFQYDHEDNRGIAPRPLTTLEDLFSPRTEPLPGTQVDNSLTTILAGIQQKIGTADLTVDWIHRDREDRLNSGLDSNSDQLRSRLNVPLTRDLTFIAQNETTLSQETDAIYSDRTLLGLNWQVVSGINVQLAQQFFTRGQFEGQSITSLNVIGDYKLARDTTLRGRYTLWGGANDLTMQGAIGINQGIVISPGLRLDLAYDRIFGDFLGRSAAGSRFAQPFAFGQGASALGLESGDSYSVGLEYTGSPDFKASARYEHRSSSQSRNTVISAAAAGKISPELTALLRYQQANSANQTLVGLPDTANLKFGLAYRNPRDDRFNALLRYEYRKNPATIPDSILFSTGTGTKDHLFGLEAIYAPDWRWEFYGKFALRNSRSYLASDLAGTSTATLTQLRATYRFAEQWDITGEARWIHQTAGFSETGLAIEAGYYLNPNLRLAAGYSFGRAHDRDLTGSRSAGGIYLGLTMKVNELFNGFGLQKVPSPQQTLSQQAN